MPFSHESFKSCDQICRRNIRLLKQMTFVFRVARHCKSERKVLWAFWMRHHVTNRTKREKHLLLSFCRTRVRHFYPVYRHHQRNFIRRVHAELFEGFSLLFLKLFHAFSQVFWPQWRVNDSRTKISHFKTILLLFHNFPRAVDHVTSISRADGRVSPAVWVSLVCV